MEQDEQNQDVGRQTPQDDSQQGSFQSSPAGVKSDTFAVPESYKDKGWAGKVKSMDDVWKLVDNLDGLAGKKMVVPDLENGSEAEIKTFIDTLRGQTKVEDYKFPDGSDENLTREVAQVFHDVGIPASLGNKVIEKYIGIANKIAESNVSKEGLEAEWKKSFGDSYQDSAGKTTNLIKENLSAEDKALFESLPNNALGLVYRLANSLRVAYGANDSGTAGEGQGSNRGVDVESTRKALRAKMAEMRSRPYDGDEYQKLVDELSATYK